MTSKAAVTRAIKRAADLMDDAERSRMYDELRELAQRHYDRGVSRRWWAECGRKACERGSHTKDNYYSRSGSPCVRCGVHVPYDPMDEIC